MLNTIYDLRKVGVSTIVIGHVKQKDVSDIVSGETYQVLTSDQQSNYFNAIKKNLHFLGLAYIDRQIAKEKTGKKNPVNKQDIVKGKIQTETRRIKFRDDSYAVDSGSRFANIVSEIEMNADAFIKALTDAILSEQQKSGQTIDETEKEQTRIAQAEERRIAATEQANKEHKKLESLIDKIVQFFNANKTNVDVIKPVLSKCRELGYGNPTEINNIDDAKTILAMTK